MLDYRAHRLFRLFRWPLSLAASLAFYLMFVISALAVRSYLPSFHLLLQVPIAWIGGLVAASALANISSFVGNILQKVFFWFIDVIPAHGAGADEARAVVTRGPIVVLSKKLGNHIGEWTDQDTDALVACMGWRRWLFPFRRRLELLVEELNEIYWTTGVQLAQSPETIYEAVYQQAGKKSWLEIALAQTCIFGGMFSLAIVVLILLRAP